jgi:hypothetical protein
VTVFTPVDGGGDEPVAVELVDHGIVVVVRVTSVSATPLAVTDVIVNGEFHPLLSVGDLKRLFLDLQWPRQMNYGASFLAVVQAPQAAAKVQEWCCYPKRPNAVMVSTSQGDFSFVIGEMILQSE